MGGVGRRRKLLGRGVASKLILQEGLLAEYLLDAGAGQVIEDSSGNGLHGTLGANSGVATDDPTWTATGLSFDGGDFARTGTLPAVFGFDIVFKPSVAWGPATAVFGLLSPEHNNTGILIGSQNAGVADEIIGVQRRTQGGYAVDHRYYWTDAAGEISAAWHLLQVDIRAAPDYATITLDGVNKKNTDFGTPTVEGFIADEWRLGDYFSGDNMVGDIAYAAFYGDMGGGLGRSNAQQAQNRTALTTILAARGITLP